MKELLDIAIKAAIEAGERIVEIYDTDFEVFYKKDKSPITYADLYANNIIKEHLDKTGIMIISEETKIDPDRFNQEFLWMVDPLDGTRDFTNRTNDFAVNIALIRNGDVVLGVIYVPVYRELFYAAEGIGSFKVENIDTYTEDLLKNAIQLPYKKTETYTIVTSRNHIAPMDQELIETISRKKKIKIIERGSALKFGMIAEGSADLYSRMNGFCEWDAAAGHAIVKYAGRTVTDMYGREPRYNKSTLSIYSLIAY